MSPASFKTAFEGKGGYQEGIESVGDKKTPSWLKAGCFSLLSIPVIGGGWAIIDAIFISGAGREHIPMYCGGALGLIAIGIGTAIKNSLKKK